jgi:hypothetical protein
MPFWQHRAVDTRIGHVLRSGAYHCYIDTRDCPKGRGGGSHAIESRQLPPLCARIRKSSMLASFKISSALSSAQE